MKAVFREAVKNIEKHRLSTFLLVLLVTLLFLLLGLLGSKLTFASDTLSVQTDIDYSVYKYYRVFGTSWKFVSEYILDYNLFGSERAPDEVVAKYPVHSENVKEIFNALDECKYVKYSATCNDCELQISEFSNRSDIHKVNSLVCFKSFFNTETQIKLSSGRFFSDEEFIFDKTKPIPVIIGYSLSELFKVGDIIYNNDYLGGSAVEGVGYSADYYTGDIEYVVVGILEPDSCYINRDVYSVNLNSYILFAFTDNQTDGLPANQVYADYYSEIMWDYQFAFQDMKLLVDAEHIDEGEAEIRAAFDTYEKFGPKYYTEETTGFLEVYREVETKKIETFFTWIIIMLFFTLAGIIMTMRNRMSNNMKDYGVHILTGAKKKDIIISALFEQLLILGCGLVLVLLPYTWFTFFSKYGYTGIFSLTTALLLAAAIIIVTICSLLTAYLTFRKKCVSDMIRREE